jgi:hypothetical protein
MNNKSSAMKVNTVHTNLNVHPKSNSPGIWHRNTQNYISPDVTTISAALLLDKQNL